jgi:hypothetical protein
MGVLCSFKATTESIAASLESRGAKKMLDIQRPHVQSQRPWRSVGQSISGVHHSEAEARKRTARECDDVLEFFDEVQHCQKSLNQFKDF